MPGAGSRKKPFSGKQKKQQLQTKREKQQYKEEGISPASTSSCSFSPSTTGQTTVETLKSSNDARTHHKNEFSTTLDEASRFEGKFFEVKHPTTKAEAGRYSLMFRKESKEELNRQRRDGRKTVHPVLEEYLECNVEDFFTSDLNFPVRPPWNYDYSREQIERNEYNYFHEYLRRLDANFQKTELSYFELNLETWRQLWRVLEMSDILLCVVDIRYPPLLFPPKLYDYVCTELGKYLILILNKADLCPAPLVLAWREYFKTKYPQLKVLCFTSYPSYNLLGNESTTSMKGQRKKGRQKMAYEGALELFKVCEEFVQGEVDLAAWKMKILEEMDAPSGSEDDAGVQVEKVVTEKADTTFFEFKKFNGGILTIGCLGQPNVGKSSLINALMGKKVVSVSKTPGHTKHFQTIFLTQNVRLCDCPGLIFPSKIPKALQVLCGSFPIAQLREPYSTVKYLAERLDLPKILRISHPEGESEWCACDIADGWAAKRGYFTAKAARLDTYRGANHILRLALDGRICLCLYPVGYTSSKDEWNNDPRVSEVLHVQAKSKEVALQHLQAENSSEDDEEYDAGPGDCEERTDIESDNDGKSEQPKVSVKKKISSVAVKNKFALLLDDNSDDE